MTLECVVLKVWSGSLGQLLARIGDECVVLKVWSGSLGQPLARIGDECVLLKVWSGSLGQPVAHIGDKSYGSAACVAFHPNGEQVLAGFHSGHLRLYDVSTGLHVYCLIWNV